MGEFVLAVLRMVGGWSFLPAVVPLSPFCDFDPAAATAAACVLRVFVLPLVMLTFCLFSFDEVSEVQYATRTNGTFSAT